MSGRRLRIALAAEDGAGTQVLRRVAAAGHEVAVVLTDGRARAAGATVGDAARRMGLAVRSAAGLRDAATASVLGDLRVDLLLNVHSLHVVHPDVLRAPALGAFNLHPGPLPGLAGLNVPCWALYLGHERHGVTLHRMAPEVDAGDVAYAAGFPIGPEATGLTLMTACVRQGLALVDRLVATAAEGRPIPAVRQDGRLRRWFDAAPPGGGWIDWAGPAERIAGLVRACDWGPAPSPWGVARGLVDGEPVEVLRVRRTGMPATAAPGTTDTGPGGELLVAAADEWVGVTRAAAPAIAGVAS